jgi:hypothetical protein
MTLFFMVQGAEAVLPTKLQYGSPKVRAYQSDAAEEAQKDAIDFLKESMDATVTRSAGYEQALRQYHAHRILSRAFQVGDLVIRPIRTKNGKHKLSRPWEGPYLVAEVLRPGAYRL